MRQTPKFFNRKLLLQNKLSAVQQPNYQNLNEILFKPSLKHIINQLSYIQKEFKNIAIIGNQADYFLQNLPINIKPENVFIADVDKSLVDLSMKSINLKQISYKIYPLVIEEELWCFKPNSPQTFINFQNIILILGLDLIVSSGHLHFVNDLQVTLQRFIESLEPDGVLIGSIFGESSFEELRIAFTLAELERSGGVSPHINPFITIVEMGNLLSRCHYNIPTVFQEKRLLEFDSCLECFQFLQDLGENSSLQNYRPGILKDVILSTCIIFDQLNREKNGQKTISIEEIYFSGWKYHESQPKAKKRGSAQFSLKDLKTEIKDIDSDVNISSGQLEEEDELQK